MDESPNYERGLKRRWQQLELYHSQKPLPAKRCRECGAANCVGPLCLDCNDERLRLKERFHKFPIPDDVPATDEDAERRRDGHPTQPRIAFAPRAEWFPYKDPED